MHMLIIDPGRSQKRRRKARRQRAARILLIVFFVAVFVVLTYINFDVACGADIEISSSYTKTPTVSTSNAAFIEDLADVQTYEPDERDVIMVAQMMFGECACVTSTTERAACAWTVCNRVDDVNGIGYWPSTIAAVIAQPTAFYGYSPDNPIYKELFDLAKDVLWRWNLEKAGYTDIGRVLPEEYVYFCSDGTGRHNVFRDEWTSSAANKWDWSLPSPYES